MTEQKIEQFWRDATAEDIAKVMKGEKVEARFRDEDSEIWKDREYLGGYRTFHKIRHRFIDIDGITWKQCQVYDPPEWVINKPDSGEGWRLLEKFPDEPKLGTDEFFDVDFTKEWGVVQIDNGIQDSEVWYRRRIEPKQEKNDCGVFKLLSNEVIQIPNGKRFKVTKEGFEVL